MVHTPLSRRELFNHPQGKEKFKEESDDMRILEVWDDNDIHEVERLKKQAQEEGRKFHIAEAMPIGSIKNFRKQRHGQAESEISFQRRRHTGRKQSVGIVSGVKIDPSVHSQGHGEFSAMVWAKGQQHGPNRRRQKGLFTGTN